MQHLSWTGTVGTYLNPLFLMALVSFLILAVAAAARGFSPRADGHNLINPTPPSMSLIGPSLVIGLALWLLSLAGISLLAPLAMDNIWLSLILCLILGAIAGFVLFQIPAEMIFKLVWLAFYVSLMLLGLYLLIGVFVKPETMGIVGAISQRLIPTWIALAVTFAL